MVSETRLQAEADLCRLQLVALLRRFREHLVCNAGRPLVVVRYWEVSDPDGSRDMWAAFSDGYCVRATVFPEHDALDESPSAAAEELAATLVRMFRNV